MADRVRFGIIGLGIGAGQAWEMTQLPELCEVKALIDTNETVLKETANAYPGAYTFTNYREMLEADDVDAVLIATPNFLHKEMTVAALEAGKHVLCQKPPAMNVEEVNVMFDTAEKAGKTLMISLNQRFEYSNLWLKSLIDQGEMGEPYYGKAGWIRRRHTQPGWFTDKSRSGGGPLIDLGVHVLDVALFLMGYPRVKSVKASVVNKMTPEVTVEDMAMALIQFENGGAMTLENSLNLNIEKETVYCQVAGTKGGAQAYPPMFFTEKGGENINMQPVQAGYEPHLGQGIALLKHFIECCNTGKQPIVTREQMVTLMRILCAIYESGETGREVVF